MTAYKKYPRYKNSGVEWLGDVPEHWEVLRFSRLYNLRMGETILAEELQDFGDLPVYSATERDSVFGYTSSHKSLLNCGDLVIPARGVSIGSVKLVRTKATATQTTIIATSPNKRVNPIFGYYWSIGHRSELFDYDHTAIPQITVAQIRAKPFPLPPLPEQHAIAEYLDRETAALDALIEKKERLMELLEEKRQALISHAVTKGLNPNAPMKDSGVEWLGEVPAHWEVKKIKWKFSAFSSGATPKGEQFYTEEPEIPWITTSELREEEIYSSKKYITTNAFRTHSALQLHPENSLLIAMYGATVGRVGLLRIAATSNQACFAIHPIQDMLTDFMFFWFQTFRAELINLSLGAGQPNISATIIKNLIFPSPHVSSTELEEIVSHIKSVENTFNTLLTTTRRSIDLLKEKRSALITAVVTGQVDVRDEVA